MCLYFLLPCAIINKNAKKEQLKGSGGPLQDKVQMKIGVISDIHLYRKTERFVCALNAFKAVDVLLIAGDIADRAQKEQYELAYRCIKNHLGAVPVYCVSGNHDNPARDDADYREFEAKINPEAAYIQDDSGAFYRQLSQDMDLMGLNPVYHQKQFFFTDKGKQLDFLKGKLEKSAARCHIVLCHPPLIAHNPQRKPGMAPYIVREQNDRLQSILDDNRNVIFISGHTHVHPTVEWEEERRNLYINDGSICPTSAAGKEDRLQQGNVTLLNIEEGTASVLIQGIHTGNVFFSESYALK